MAFKVGSCYCGCGTKGNKIKWAIAVLGVLIGAGLLVATFVVATGCYVDYDDCMNSALDAGRISPTQYDQYHLGRSYSDNATPRTLGQTGIPAIDNCENDYADCVNQTVGYTWGWILAWIIASIPLYMMCCCTARPNSSHNHGHQFAHAAPAHTTYQSHTGANQTDGYNYGGGAPANYGGGGNYGGGATYDGGYNGGAQGNHGGPPAGYPKPTNV